MKFLRGVGVGFGGWVGVSLAYFPLEIRIEREVYCRHTQNSKLILCVFLIENMWLY